MKLFRVALLFPLITFLFSACQKEYSIEGNAPVMHVGSWQFNDNTILYTGSMDSAYIKTTAGLQSLYLIGTSTDGTEKFTMVLNGTSIIPGDYRASLFQSDFRYTAGASNVYAAGQAIGEFIVTITSISPTSVSGTFYGTAQNASNNTIQITRGKFNATLAASSNGGVSSGVLVDSSGNCQPATISGNYAQGVVLDASNTVQLMVTVITPGSYTISSNTVNGVSFSQSGNFSAAGAQPVTLIGSGTPLLPGVQNFAVNYGSSQCNFKITFLSPASGTLGGSSGSCTPFSIAGNYQQGVALTGTNTVQIQVNVTSAGAYNITTNTINGVYFSTSGVFTNTGIQTVTLIGNGTPVNSGSQNFTVGFGASLCNFSIAFLPGVSTSNDYFPLTVNSNWTYSLEGGTAADSIHSAVISYAPVFAGNGYSTIAFYNEPFNNPASDSFYYRKLNGDYYQFTNYSALLPFDQSVQGENIFLKDYVTTGTVWNSPTISGTISGVPVTANIKMTLLAKAVPVSIGAAFSFPDVIKVKYEYFISGSPSALIVNERWFARNVGEIYDSYNDLSLTQTYNIGNYIVF